jgi:uncharacterized membrane protein
MANLIVVGFKKDLFRASQVLNQLAELNDAWTVDLRDAVAVYRDYNGKLRVDQSYLATTGEGAGWGAVWGSLGAIGGAVDSEWWKDTVGISEEFVHDVGAMVQPGDSAIFTMIRSADPDFVANVFRGYGGTILRSSLTKEQADKVQAVLDGKA